MAEINFDPSVFFLKPFYLLISVISRTWLQNIKLQKWDVKTFWFGFVNIDSTFFLYFILIQAQDGLHTNITHLRLLWTSMVYMYMQHLANLGKDKSYLQKDSNKFKHWYQKWTCRIPIFVRDMVKNMRPFLAELWTLGQGGDKLLSLVWIFQTFTIFYFMLSSKHDKTLTLWRSHISEIKIG